MRDLERISEIQMAHNKYVLSENR